MKGARTFVRNGARMLAKAASLMLSITIGAVATIAVLRPYTLWVHSWEAALTAALAGLVLLVLFFNGLRSRNGAQRFAALGALGGAVISIAFVAAELLVGPPQRIAGAPGQTFAPPHAAGLEVAFPQVSAADLAQGRFAKSVDVIAGSRRRSLAIGQTLRAHSFVLRCEDWPAAYVEARSPRAQSETVTQPTGAAFVSPVLQFPNVDSDGLPVDSFSVPAMHREVRAKYYPGLPSRGIDIPFVQLQINEENGGVLYNGVAVNNRPVRQAGVVLTFAIGTYPIVWMTGAPDLLGLCVGALMLAAGIIGFVSSPRAGMRT